MTAIVWSVQTLEDHFGPALGYCTARAGQTSVTDAQLADVVMQSLRFVAYGGEEITLLEESASNADEAEIMLLVGSYAILDLARTPEELERAFQLIRPAIHHPVSR